MRYLYTLLLLGLILVWSSCRDDFETSLSSGDLTFSRDTVYLDTVFTNIGSSTYNLKVYNRSDNAIRIPTVGLERGETSNYRLNVDGIAGKAFQDVEILAKDSIFIFVETTLDITDFTATDGDFLYTDAITFDSGAEAQRVELVTLVRDAIFLFPDREEATGIIEKLNINGVETEIEGRYLLDDELTFTNEKPYVIYGYMAVGDPDGNTPKTLNIEAGARIHIHNESGIIVADNATLSINGSLSTDPEQLENEVIIESDRLEPIFSEVPGQWGTILLTDGSINNTINYATIKNAQVGILNESSSNTGNPNLTITNTQIYNSSNVGLLNRFSNVVGANLVINNAGQFALLNQLGGQYNFTHCTFANYWTQGFRTTPAVFLDNSLIAGETLFLGDLTEANFTNCIIYGNQGEELGFNQEDGAAFNFTFTNTLIRFDDTFGQFSGVPNYDFTNTAQYENILISEEPDFQKPSENVFFIGEDTAGESFGLLSAAAQFPTDITGDNRSSAPDLGAYQSIIFPVED